MTIKEEAATPGTFPEPAATNRDTENYNSSHGEEKETVEQLFPDFQYVDLALGDASNRNHIIALSELKQNMREWKRTHGELKDCFRSLFRYTVQMKDHIEKAKSVKGYAGSCYSDCFVLDIDDQNLAEAQETARAVLIHLRDSYGVDLNVIRIYFSGSKGFHIELRSALFGFKPSVELPRIFKAIAEKLVPEGVVIDSSIYERSRLWRIQNTINSKSGLYKVPLYAEEIFSLPIGEIKALAAQPRRGVIYDDDVDLNPHLAALYADVMENRGNGIKSSGDAAKRYKKASNGPIPEGERNSTLTSLAGRLKSRGIPIDEAEMYLDGVNRTRCKPPLGSEEVGTVLDSVYSYQNIDETEPSTEEAEVIRLSEHDPEPQRWILTGALPEGHTTTVFGDGGQGKSYFAIYLGILAAAGGQSFFGLEFPEKPLNVLILDFELNADEQARRARRIAAGVNFPDIPKPLFYYSPTQGLLSLFPTLQGIISEKNIDLVIIDSLGPGGVDGKETREVVAFFAGLRRLGVTTLALDHQSKLLAGEKYDQKTPYGSAYKGNLSRSIFQLSKLESEPGRMTLGLRQTKSNFGPLLDTNTFDVVFEDGLILFTTTDYRTPEDDDVELIGDKMDKLHEEGISPNQSRLAEALKGMIGVTRLRVLLKKWEGKAWTSKPGSRGELIYTRIPRQSRGSLLACYPIYRGNKLTSSIAELDGKLLTSSIKLNKLDISTCDDKEKNSSSLMGSLIPPTEKHDFPETDPSLSKKTVHQAQKTDSTEEKERLFNESLDRIDSTYSDLQFCDWLQAEGRDYLQRIHQADEVVNENCRSGTVSSLKKSIERAELAYEEAYRAFSGAEGNSAQHSEVCDCEQCAPFDREPHDWEEI